MNSVLDIAASVDPVVSTSSSRTTAPRSAISLVGRPAPSQGKACCALNARCARSRWAESGLGRARSGAATLVGHRPVEPQCGPAGQPQHVVAVSGPDRGRRGGYGHQRNDRVGGRLPAGRYRPSGQHHPTERVAQRPGQAAPAALLVGHDQLPQRPLVVAGAQARRQPVGRRRWSRRHRRLGKFSCAVRADANHPGRTAAPRTRSGQERGRAGLRRCRTWPAGRDDP